MKLTDIQDTTTAVIDLKHPVTGALLGATITVAGPENSARKAIDFAKQRRIRAAFQKSGKIELGDPADDEQDLIEKLAACTLGWTGITDDAGMDIPFSKAAAQSMYAREGLGWLRTQVAAAMDERERFITACAPS